MTSVLHTIYAPVAQRIRASVFGTEGRRFESVRVYHTYYVDKKILLGSFYYKKDILICKKHTVSLLEQVRLVLYTLINIEATGI